ncbi:ABC transporter permease [Nordella sp. HKS 07]|uniref:MlaE family ABC transporter permease n=1 Tax=Nordella sp. HKS 07 TaxID=2712222 RepID=UPI0013E12DB8|nr:ABC transporter permease [Nordella sp. HKS 07]QIG50656.1 ABC transporter permease [Nordella sp. HKS 07]
MNFLANLGRVVLALLTEIGSTVLFIKDALVQGLTPTIYVRQIFEQMLKIGYNSLPVVGLTAFFTGGALALQIYLGGSRFNAESLVSTIVALGITRELGPVLAGLMVAGRVGASIAAELGTMRVTEQIDALTTLATNPFKYLVGPRILAGVITLPILVFIADIIGIMGGYVIGTRSLGFNSFAYIKSTADFLQFGDVMSGLIKAAVFGFIITLMGCYHGFHSKGGAQGVGRATTNAVVSSAILILAANFVLTSLLFSE